jgi:hypothetical protein
MQWGFAELARARRVLLVAGMKKSTKPKLSLASTTIRELRPAQLATVGGGLLSASGDPSCYTGGTCLHASTPA